jgi:hypothetical protein
MGRSSQLSRGTRSLTLQGGCLAVGVHIYPPCVLELARIGSQLFVFDSATCDLTAAPDLFETFATRLSAQPLIHSSA